MTVQLTGRSAASVATPPANVIDLFSDSADSNLAKYRDPAGNLHVLSGQGMSGFYDVTNYGVLASNSAAANDTAIAALLAAVPNGATVYFPPTVGSFQFLAAISPGAKALTFMGGGFVGGQFSTLATASPTNNLFTIADNQWYTTFDNLVMTTTVNRTAGAYIQIGTAAGAGCVSTNIRRCTFTAPGGAVNAFNCVVLAGTQAGNQMTVDSCIFNQFTSFGIQLLGNTTANSTNASLVIVNTTMNGNYAANTGAVACLNFVQAGAIQIDNSDFIGAVNNLLVNPATGAPVQGVFSLYATNTYFDNSFGSCVKMTGAGNIERCKFLQCSFTTALAVPNGFTAIEITTTAVILATAIDIIGCNILNTFGTTGATTGVLINGAQDVSIVGCRIAGWALGVSVTPSASSVTKPYIVGNVIGPTGNIAANTTGIILAAGTYGSLTILYNNMMGNGTALTDNSTVTTTANNNRLIKNNQGFNPKSVVAQPAVPATGVNVFNSTGVDCMVYVKGGTLTAITVGGVVTGIAGGSGATGLVSSVLVAANQSINIAFTVAPTWVWVGT